MKIRKFLRGPKVNRVVKYFVAADLMLFAGWGFIAPIFAIFIIDEIRGATLVSVGITSGVFWLSRAVVMPPVANYIDKRKGEKDDLYALILGLFFMSASAFAFITVSTLMGLYIVQAIHGLAMGVYSVAWATIFSMHLDRERPAFDWSIDKAATSMSVAITSFIGGWLASTFGFDITFVIAGTLSVTAAVVIFLVPDLVLPPSKSDTRVAEHHRHQPPTTG